MHPILLLVTYTAKPGMRERFLRETAESGLLETIRREDGCLAYRYFLSAEDDRQILLIEKWASPERQQTHMAQPHMERLAEIKARWIDQTSVERIYLEGGDPK